MMNKYLILLMLLLLASLPIISCDKEDGESGVGAITGPTVTPDDTDLDNDGDPVPPDDPVNPNEDEAGNCLAGYHLHISHTQVMAYPSGSDVWGPDVCVSDTHYSHNCVEAPGLHYDHAVGLGNGGNCFPENHDGDLNHENYEHWDP